MKIRVGDREYPLVTPRSANGQLSGGMTLQSLFDLRRQSTDVFGFEVGLAKLDELGDRAQQLKRQRAAAISAGDEAAVRSLEAAAADDGLVNMAVLVFLSRRAAGDRCSLAEAAAVDIGDIEWIAEPGDPTGDDPDEESPDPTRPGTEAASPETPDVALKGKAGKKRPASGGRGRTSSARSVSG